MDMIFNTIKTKCMIFSKRYLQKNYHVSLNGQSIEFVNSITYLCVILKNDLSDSDEIEY